MRNGEVLCKAALHTDKIVVKLPWVIEMERNSFDVEIDFCREKKKIYFSSPISKINSEAVRRYVEVRKSHTFKPHLTSYHIDQEMIRIVQEIPFFWGHQPNMRELLAQYRRVVKWCHRTLSEIALEEKLRVLQQGPGSSDPR